MVKYGYIRVSTKGQNPARQIETIEQYAEPEHIFLDKCSGGTTERPALHACLETIQEGDTLYCHSIDRLARNLQNFLDLIATFREKKVTVHFLKENLCVTGADSSVTDLYLSVIAAAAQFEKSLINERRQEGWLIMKETRLAAGLPEHPRGKLSPERRDALKQEILDQKSSLEELSKKYGLSISSISRMRKDYFKEKGWKVIRTDYSKKKHSTGERENKKRGPQQKISEGSTFDLAFRVGKESVSSTDFI